MPQRVSTTALRPRLAELLAQVQAGRGPVIVTRHDHPIAALISMAELRRVWAAEDEARDGPIDPTTGRPFGRRWVEDLWGGEYRREEDPESHLRPSRAQAPWLGRPFPWPPQAEARSEPPEAEARSGPAEAPEPAAPAAPRGWLRRLLGGG